MLVRLRLQDLKLSPRRCGRKSGGRQRGLKMLCRRLQSNIKIKTALYFRAVFYVMKLNAVLILSLLCKQFRRLIYPCCSRVCKALHYPTEYL